jgi:hypothetical protein
MRLLKFSQQEIAAVYALPGDEQEKKIDEIITMRGRVNGKPVNVFVNPDSAPDPHNPLVHSKLGYGLNLDDRNGPGDLTNPDTGETGIDNNFYKTVGCVDTFKLQKDGISGYTKAVGAVEGTPAHLILITGVDDPLNDPDVTVYYYTALEPVILGADGKAIADRTYRIDPDVRWHNVTHGKITNGVLTTEPFSRLRAEGEPSIIPVSYDLARARIRLNLKPQADGHLTGLLGGYQPWYSLYWSLARSGRLAEKSNLNVVGFYYSVKRMADFDPDPATGENRRISIDFNMDAVPAIILGPAPAVAAGSQTAARD